MVPTDEPDRRSIEMDPVEVEAFLTDRGHGVLSLVQDGDPYGVPVSFGYDGERVFFTLLRFGEDSEKLSAVAETDRASLVVTDVETRYEWRSVLARGRLSTVPDEENEYVEEVMDDNAWFPNVYPPTAPITDVDRLAMTVGEATGRQGGRFQ